MIMKLLAGNSNPIFAKDISEHLDVPLVNAEIKSFSDGETKIDIKESMRGQDVFVIQSTSQPANQHLMELLITIDALQRASARRITAVMPYFGYARQDSKPGPRTPITAKLVANLLSTAGANRMLTMDLHSRQIQGFFDFPVDNLYSIPTFAKHIRNNFLDAMKNVMIISPDVGGVVRARALAKKLEADLGIIDKRREKDNDSEVMNVIGDVKNRTCIIIDDMVDTAGTLCNAAKALKSKGALSVYAYATHGVLSGPAIDRIDNSVSLSNLTVTDSIKSVSKRKVNIVSVVPLFSKAIKRIHDEASISALFN